MTLRVLLVEDDTLNAELARDLLESSGHEVDHVSDARGLRARLTESRAVHVILMDLLLPDGNGEQLLREVRASSPAHVPIIAVTAQALRGDAERLLAAGFDAVLNKPIDTHSFVADIERVARRESRD
jgi:two-component system, sensor histidine kinase